MTRNYRKYDEDFKQGAVQLVTQTGKPIAQVARDLVSTRARPAASGRRGRPAGVE